MRTTSLCLIRWLFTAILMFLSLNAISQIPKAKFSIQPVSGTDNFTFTNQSEGSQPSYSWSFPGGNPSTSTNANPIIEFSTAGNYTATLTTSNAEGTSTFSMDFIISEGNFVDLCTGKYDDGTLMSGIDKIFDEDWTYIHPNGTVTTPQTRETYPGWSHATHPPLNDKKSVWISGRNTITGYHYYKSKSFTIPESVSNAKLTLRSLSFARNWTYLVKENVDGTETETEITKTTWMSDGAKGWVNSRSPLVDKMEISSGTYHIKVKVYTSNSSVQQAIDVNAFLDYSFESPPSSNFSANILSTDVGSPVTFTNLSEGSPVSYAWKFKDGNNEILSSDENPVITFTKPGFHDVELTVIYANGLSSTLKMKNYVETIANYEICFSRLHHGFADILIPVDLWNGNVVNVKIFRNNVTLIRSVSLDTSGLTKVNIDGVENYYIKIGSTNYLDQTLTFEVSSPLDAAVSNTLPAIPQNEWSSAGTNETCVEKANVCFTRLHHGYAEILIPVTQWNGSVVNVKIYQPASPVIGNTIYNTINLTKIIMSGLEYYYIKTENSIGNYINQTLTFEVSSPLDAAVSNTLPAIPQNEWSSAGTNETCVEKANVCFTRLHHGYTEILIPVNQWNGSAVHVKIYQPNGTVITNTSLNTSTLAKIMMNGLEYYYLKPGSTNYLDQTLTFEVSSPLDAAVSNTLPAIPQNEWSSAGTNETCVEKANVCFTRLHHGYAEILIPVTQWNGSVVNVKIYQPGSPVIGSPSFNTSNLTKLTMNGLEYYYLKPGVASYYIDKTLTFEVSSPLDAAVSNTLEAIPQNDWNDFSLQENCINKTSGICINRNNANYVIHIPVSEWNNTNARLQLYNSAGAVVANQLFSNLVSETHNGVPSYKVTANISSYSTSNLVVELSSVTDAPVYMYLTPVQQLCYEYSPECDELIIPIFSQIEPVYAGENFILPTISDEGITGIWSPEVNNEITTTYTFTPDEGQCAEITTMTVEILDDVNYTNAPNSYIFDPYQDEYDGLYIPVKKAYDMWANSNGYFAEAIETGILSASIMWQDVTGLIKSDPSTPTEEFDLPVIGSGNNAKVKVLVDKSKGEGNAVVAFKVNGEVKWSWHVWVTDSPEIGASNTALQPYNKNLNGDFFAPTFMDRNLGATHNSFLGNEWNKSGGLMYEWGRKDPFPSLVYKDYTFYEVEGEVGIVKHKHSKSSNTVSMENFTILRPFNDIASNIKYSVENPFNYIYTSNQSHWFSSANHLGPIPENPSRNKMFDLWSDNYSGGVGGLYPNSPNFKPYQLKSSFDPCPNGWRVPTFNGQQVYRTAFSPWGRDSGSDDDATDATIYPNTTNTRLNGVKIYPGLGVDFSAVTNRSIGRYPLTGGFEQYDSGKPYFQDPFSESNLWTATSFNNSGRSMLIVSDYARIDESEFGLYTFNHSSGVATQITQTAQAVRCIVDPNESLLPDFSTEYIVADNSKRNYKIGLDNPNSYLIDDNQQELMIPISKAFAIYNQYLTDRGWPSGTLGTKVVWTSNTSLVEKVSLENTTINNPDNGNIKVEFGENNPKGNAVVSLTLNDVVMWSWHIWAPNTNPTVNTVTYTNEESIPTLNLVNFTKSGVAPLTTTFMDRNLGALEMFPDVVNPTSPTSTEITQIENSGGLHFQWGRKDPIPSFLNVGSGNYFIYLETGKDINGNSVFGTTVNSADYLSNLTSEYSTYGASSSANRNEKILQSLDYSIKNPLRFLYHSGTGSPENYTQIKDWMADERNLGDNRWGHADKKSPFDPCPNGWRVPDVSFTFLHTNTIQLGSSIFSGAIGTSPWYRNKILSISGLEQNRHLIQLNPYEIGSNYYEGAWASGYGWLFNNPSYKVGNFPATGIRGYLGNNTISNPNTLSGVWTSSLGDSQYGFAIGLYLGINSGNTKGMVKSGEGFYPQAGMNVRCALDEPRYSGTIPSEKNESTIDEEVIDGNKFTQVIIDSEFIYPNPVTDILKIRSIENNELHYQIFDMSGRYIQSGKFVNNSTDLSSLKPGIYLMTLNETTKAFRIIKK